MRISSLLASCIFLASAQSALGCGPPPKMELVPGPGGTSVPWFNEYAYAYIGKVVGHSKDESDNPALDVQVLDAWTPVQKNGDVLKVTVQPWSGCGLPRKRGDFDPSKYPIGTRLRVITFTTVIATWDERVALVVLGSAP